MTTTKKRERLYQGVVDQICQSIRSGEFSQGSRMPSERELAERYDVSRVTIREATIALEAKGIVDIRGGSGTFVKAPAHGNAMTLPDVSAFDLTTARMIFEAEAAAMAAVNISDDQLEELADIVRRMAVSHDGPGGGDDLDRQFHLGIASAANNPAIEHCVRELWRMRNDVPQVKRLYERVCSINVDKRENEHMHIFEALAARDPAKARAAMREHFRRLFDTMVNAEEAATLNALRVSLGNARERFLQAASPV